VEWPTRPAANGPLNSRSIRQALTFDDRHWGQNCSGRMQPFYQCETGRGLAGWDAFFDFPPALPREPQLCSGVSPETARRDTGDRVEVVRWMRLGIFEGEIVYIFYPGSRLIEQQAPSTQQQESPTLRRRPSYECGRGPDCGRHHELRGSYFDTKGMFQRSYLPMDRSVSPRRCVSFAVAARTPGRLGRGVSRPHQFCSRAITHQYGLRWYTSVGGRHIARHTAS